MCDIRLVRIIVPLDRPNINAGHVDTRRAG